MVKIISWNVNGLRTRILDHLDAKSFTTKTTIENESSLGEIITQFDPDILCFQETRCAEDNLNKFQIEGYYKYHNSSQLEGARSGNRYSGVAIWSKLKANNCITHLPTLEQPNLEGRIIILEFDHFILINTYQPNAGSNFIYRTTQWDPAMISYLATLKTKNIPIVWTGDLNIARTPRDLYIGSLEYKYKNHKNINDQEWRKKQLAKYWQTDPIRGMGERALAGFTLEERVAFEKIIALGFVDTWRHLNPKESFTGYTWWSFKIPKSHNKGWRIDYFVVTKEHIDKVKQFHIFTEKNCFETTGKRSSDHAPIGLEIDL